MSFMDARDPSVPRQLEAGVCIVGAGAAGITLAKALAGIAGGVLLVESGGFEPDEATQSLYQLNNIGYPQRPDYMSRARYFGGSCNLWAGRSMTLQPHDFAARPWVPHSGWPISFDAVDAWYTEAARILDLPPVDEAISQVDRMTTADERTLLHSSALAPTHSLWARKPKRFGSSTRAALRRASNLRVLTHASAVGLVPADTGTSIRSLRLRTLAGREIEVTAKRFVLACGGIENPRLLLASHERWPAGIANEHDVVGRYFMDHPRAVFGRLHAPASARLKLLRGRPLAHGKLQLGLALSPQQQAECGALNHYVTLEAQHSGYTEARYQSFVQTMKVALKRGYAGNRWDIARSSVERLPEMIYLLSPKELMPHPVYRAYVGLRDAWPRKQAATTYVLVYFCEQPPDPRSRVTLDTQRDALGMNVANLDWHLGADITASVLGMQDVLRGEFARAGLGSLEAGSGEPTYTDASHHMGTTRMSLDPRQGVVDTDCRAHGVDNLYLAGSSVFPSAGYANPTLTIVALALRLADHLRKQEGRT